ncbi:copper resistance protein CopC [Nocardioides sp.]|uniref:copper resistance CopC/CopD family protein n=1 Tax=Nocardioides sp. TaxID=35761 RepID=UPI0027196CE0|nr:copper resistance protein CopC [Nocardioides sp.]MDO9455883.1 copper resistance protein CopC [Nocardioides sp.]
MIKRAALLLAALAAVLVTVVGAAAPASAHATLVGTDPAEGEVLAATPDVVTFTFDEPVSLPAGAVQVFDAAGEPVDSDSTSRDTVITTDLPDELADGSYVVVWRAISADGHPIAGSLTFSVGAPSAEVAPPQLPDVDPAEVRSVLSVFQGLSYAGLLLASGLVLFLAWTMRGVRVDDAVGERVLKVAWSAAGVALVAGFAGIPLTGAYQQGLGLDQLGESAAVDLALVGDDLVVLGLQVVGLVVALTQLARPRVAIAAAAVATVSPAVVGHSRAIEPVWLLVTTDVLHLSAGAAWFGGLVGLVLTLRALSGRERDAALVLSRFSAVAAGLLGLLAVTGSLQGWRILGGWDPLFDTTYGRLLLVKVGIAAVVAAIAGFNRWRLLPAATGRSGAAGHGARRASVLRVRDVVRVEAGLLVVLLGVTGFLTNQSPREGPSNRAPVASRVEVGVLAEDAGTKVLATMAPRTRGPNTITVQVQDQAGEPLDGFAEPTVSVASADGSVDLGSQPVVPTDAGTYVVETVIPAPGTWEVQVSLRASEFDNPVTTVSFEVS